MRHLGRRSALTLGVTVAAVLRPASALEGSAFPTRPVRLLVGFAPGGPLDFVTRALAERLTQRLGQPFASENRPGAASNLAAEAVARATPPDGSLLLMGTPHNLAVNVALQRDLPFDPTRDLAPVAQVASVPYLLVVPAELPVNSVAELIALARARPGTLNAGTAGVGSVQHLVLELLKLRAGGIDIAHIPFRGGAEVHRELLGGRLQIGIDSPVSFAAGLDSGRLRAIATLHDERLPDRPDLPTMTETPGLEGIEGAGFIGVVAPTGMPRPARARLEAAIAWAMSETDLPAFIEARGVLARFAGSEAFAALVAREREKWGRVVREAGIAVG